MAQELQLPLIAPKSAWEAPEWSQLPSWEGAKRVCIDVETRDEKLKAMGPGVRRPDCYIVGVSFAIEDGPAFYLPFRHGSGDNLDPTAVLLYLRDQARVFRGDLVGAGMQYDVDFLAEDGVEFKPRFYRDVQVAEPLIDELQDSYSLDSIAGRYELPGKDEALLHEAASAYGVDPKVGLWRLDPKYVGAYAEQDVRLPLLLLRRQERAIDDQDLWRIFDMESRLLPVLVKMRRRGVRVDFDHLERVERFSLDEETKALAEAKRLTGVSVAVGDVWKAGELAKVLRAIGVEPNLTPKTKKPSIDDDFLASVDHPVAAHLRRARKVNKLRTTFVKSVRDHAVGDRVHTTFNQLRRTKDDGSEKEQGARYGRLSSVDPNLQQQPGRDPELGPFWRKIYIPDEGGEWLCADYSQQEPRWVTHYAEAARCPRATEAGDRYRNDPTTDNHQMMTDMIGWEGKDGRNRAKQIYLGLIYSMGGAKLCRKLGLPTKWIHSKRMGRMIEVAGEEGRAMLDRFDSMAPFLRDLARKCERKAEQRGYIFTAGGRRCRFPTNEKGNYDWCHKALNRLIQGTSADQMKMAMVAADAEDIPLQLQVHDELDLTIYDRKEAKVLGEIMRDALLPCNVPMMVDLEIGPSWGEAA